MLNKMTLGFKRGARVVPKSKSVWSALSECHEWEAARARNQPFLFVVDEDTYDESNQQCLVLAVNKDDSGGNYYLPSDVEIYQEEEANADDIR